jgi:hypothetical protein
MKTQDLKNGGGGRVQSAAVWALRVCNLQRCKRHGRGAKSDDKNPRKSEAEKSVVFDSVRNPPIVVQFHPWSGEDSLVRCPGKRKQKNFDSNRNKPRQGQFWLCFGLFRETKNNNFFEKIPKYALY